MTLRVAFGTDEVTVASQAWLNWLRDRADVLEPLTGSWPDVGRAVGSAVGSGIVDLGVVCCWTGTGVTIAANKVPGVRAALCGDAATAAGARRWNDANVVGLSLRATSEAVGLEVLEAYWSATVDADEAPLIARVEQVDESWPEPPARQG